MIASIYLLVFNSLIVPSALMGLHFPHSCFSISYLCKPSDKVVVIKSEVVLDKNHVIDINLVVALRTQCYINLIFSNFIEYDKIELKKEKKLPSKY